jgi:hypothetical protein
VNGHGIGVKDVAIQIKAIVPTITLGTVDDRNARLLALMEQPIP